MLPSFSKLPSYKLPSAKKQDRIICYSKKYPLTTKSLLDYIFTQDMVGLHTMRDNWKIPPSCCSCINHDYSSFCTKHDCFHIKDFSFILNRKNYCYSKKREKEATRHKTYMAEVKYREFDFTMTFGVEIDSTF